MKTPYRLIVISIISAGILLIAVVGFNRAQFSHNTLHIKDFNLLQIESISVYPLSSKETVKLSQEDMSNLIDQLNEVELIGAGTNSFSQYDGVLPRMFLIELKDGTSFVFAASNPFYIINAEQGFEADYHICDGLANTYYSLVAKYF